MKHRELLAMNQITVHVLLPSQAVSAGQRRGRDGGSMRAGSSQVHGRAAAAGCTQRVRMNLEKSEEACWHEISLLERQSFIFIAIGLRPSFLLLQTMTVSWPNSTRLFPRISPRSLYTAPTTSVRRGASALGGPAGRARLAL